ncbi:hypothetical protein CRG98_026799 [Punica granatum]|uniref:Integrase catalytic domain-containing protein n=1 Tax=Punica granatum TaxID=22663 RepID=A0A2I0J991_PUNGR|nr:hypothetical protein CRG98_026799 [Punica granatum]
MRKGITCYNCSKRRHYERECRALKRNQNGNNESKKEDETELGCRFLMKKVRHILEIRLNLISTGQFDDECYNNEFSSGRWKLSKDSLIVAQGQKTDILYKLRSKYNSGQVNVVEDYPVELWHMRLGHIGEKAMDRETSMRLKCVGVDNGGEYMGPFENYCRTHGIKREKTVLKTPQLNGLAERMNRTIVERVRCMLSQAKLSKSFWGEAMRTAVDLINLTLSIALDGDVPQQVWIDNEVSFKHLRIFGCGAFVHIPRDERSKLDAKAKQCIFLGYLHKEFKYSFWDLDSRKIIRSKDVVFFEDQTIEDLQKLEKARVSSSHEISIPIPIDVEHPVEEVPGKYEETMTGG